MQETTERGSGVAPGGDGRMEANAPPKRPARDRGGIIFFAVVALLALGFIGGGVKMLVEQLAGEPAVATVTGCDVGRRTVRCTGTWTVGGSLLQGGRVVRGSIDGASQNDVGKQIDVRLADAGERAYTNAIEQPSILIGVGAVFLAFAALIGNGLLKNRRRALVPVPVT